MANVVVIENGYDYEKMLIKNGNSNEIIAAINDINRNENYYTNYIDKLNGEVKTKKEKRINRLVLCVDRIFMRIILKK